MAAETIPQIPVNWIASNQYRVIHSNFFRYRINAGEVMLHFDTITDAVQQSGNSSVVIGEVSVAMSWTQLKALSETMKALITSIEREIGPIVLPTAAPGAIEAHNEQIKTTLLSVYGLATTQK